MKKQQNEAIKKALKLLSLKDRTEAELKEKLRKTGFDEQNIVYAIEYLKQKGFIDDSKFIQKAEKIAEDRFLGNLGLRNYLVRKGLENEKLESLPEIDELQIAQRLIQRKKHLLKDIPFDKKEAKIAGFLLRRGFSWDTINKCLKINKKLTGDAESP
ncbi:MAG: recombination regulator RecX [Thermodesulfovibrio sp.]|nr:recombination regulator RecX [Thermodesulfovibrio sp.]